MNKSFLKRFVFLILIILICMIAMVVMAVERESGQEIVPVSAIMLVITSLVPTKTFAHTSALLF